MTGAIDAGIPRDRGQIMLASALGSHLAALLAAPDTIEILANPDGSIWAERQGAGRRPTGHHLGIEARERIIRLVASLSDRQVDKMRPILSAELPPRGERFEGILPPVVVQPCFAIRKPASRIYTLENYVDDGVMARDQAAMLRHALTARRNILVAGGTGSGKTTLVNALLAELAGLDQRIVILEDTRELQCAAPDVVALRAISGCASLADLVRSTLRLRPDRIIVGEVRGGEALDLLKAWNTGHPGGVATVHANSCRSALDRLEQLSMEACAYPPGALIAEAIDLVVFIERGGAAGRIVSDILDCKPAPYPDAPGQSAFSLTDGPLS